MELGKKPYFKYCPYCKSKLSLQEKGGKPRPVCPKCGFVQYLNPTVGVAVIIMENGKILLGKRNREPFKGKWCIPCGHVEWGEDVREAAKREFKEETGLEIEVIRVFEVLSNFHDPHNLTVGVWFLGKVIGGKLKPGDDISELKFVSLDKPDVELAFPTDKIVLKKLKEEEL